MKVGNKKNQFKNKTCVAVVVFSSQTLIAAVAWEKVWAIYFVNYGFSLKRLPIFVQYKAGEKIVLCILINTWSNYKRKKDMANSFSIEDKHSN